MGPLKGIRILEIAGIGPGPFAGMMLADLGADVIRVERPKGGMFGDNPKLDILNRGKRSIGVDLKTQEGVETVLKLAESCDAMFEGFRPGVVEKLGIGPEPAMAINPRLVYGRMTGWGQDGPLAHASGHDINYISITGALHAIGNRGEKPVVPLNLVGDFGGGGLMLAFGMVSAILEAKTSGKGQVVDAAMVDGAAALMASVYGAQQSGFWSEERGTNMLDSGAHFYDTYETSDNQYICVGAFEPQFYAELLKLIGLDDEELPHQMDMGQWPDLKERFTAVFKTKTRDEWCEILDGTDACFSPVLPMSEAYHHPHNVARGTFVEREGVMQPRPVPRFSRTDSEIQRPAARVGEHTDEILSELGFTIDDINRLKENKAIK
ncbi:CaiB/BaiF CoA transferase family protein [Endozoicomonas numazuensis]|uniref:Carnitine dehydratase n=1 Tax=Endozoicomonas numazuensis TaxID=1137799 RepID=A0A081NKQ0_9GAMM|nr:CaiB/BaiF CoA-transferase family protein [Endozoicomonas numazuensis]KEQ19023.1 carnitine dehydratase [Endozoicomonas numazuensis]